MSHLDRLISARKAERKFYRLDDFLQRAAYAARQDAQSDEDHQAWERLYDLVFPEYAGKARSLASKLERHFDWYDPDTTYREDAMAFIDAVHELAADL